MRLSLSTLIIIIFYFVLASGDAIEFYTQHFDTICGVGKPFLSRDELYREHLDAKATALKQFAQDIKSEEDGITMRYKEQLEKVKFHEIVREKVAM